MVKRRQIVAAASSCLIGGSALALGDYSTFSLGEVANGHEMDTNSSGGCRSGLLERPQTDRFKIVGIVRFDEVRVQLTTTEADSVDEIIISVNGDVVHTERILGSGGHTVSFNSGESTVFKLEAHADGDTVGTAEFYSRCDDPDT